MLTRAQSNRTMPAAIPTSTSTQIRAGHLNTGDQVGLIGSSHVSQDGMGDWPSVSSFREVESDTAMVTLCGGAVFAAGGMTSQGWVQAPIATCTPNETRSRTPIINTAGAILTTHSSVALLFESPSEPLVFALFPANTPPAEVAIQVPISPATFLPLCSAKAESHCGPKTAREKRTAQENAPMTIYAPVRASHSRAKSGKSPPIIPMCRPAPAIQISMISGGPQATTSQWVLSKPVQVSIQMAAPTSMAEVTIPATPEQRRTKGHANERLRCRAL